MTKQPNVWRAIMAVRSLDATDAPIIDEIDIRRIHPNPDQPRKTFDEESLRDLAESIERHGLISPILVKAMADPRPTSCSSETPSKRLSPWAMSPSSR